MAEVTCSMPDCGKPVIARGWCPMHYSRWRSSGDPTVVRRRTNYTARTPAELMDLYLPDRPVDGCWLWTGSISEYGYGVASIRKKNTQAHRLSYEHFVGSIPVGLVIDHLCRNPPCCNPAHLEPVTNRENVLRGLKGRMVTHCPQGHEYSPENLLTKARRDCRICHAARERRRREARRAA